MIPDLPNLSDLAIPAPLFSPYNRDKAALTDYARGGVALLDASQGLDVQDWQCELDEETGGCFIWAQGQTPMRVEVFVEKPEWISMAFDQNMHYNLAYSIPEGSSFLYWYDAVVERYTTTNLGRVRTPVLRLDDFRKVAQKDSELVLSYLRGTTLCCRLQRDRFSIEYELAQTFGNIILRCGLNKKFRFQWNMM